MIVEIRTLHLDDEYSISYYLFDYIDVLDKYIQNQRFMHGLNVEIFEVDDELNILKNGFYKLYNEKPSLPIIDNKFSRLFDILLQVDYNKE